MLLRICAVAVLCAVVGLLLGELGGSFAGLARIAGCVTVVLLLLASLGTQLSELGALFAGSGVDAYAERMLRAVGLALLAKICSELCRECGAVGLAGGVELAGKLAILALCAPMIAQIVEFSAELLESG